MRHEYLKSVLRQDIGYFDTTATSGERRVPPLHCNAARIFLLRVQPKRVARVAAGQAGHSGRFKAVP